MRDTSYHFFVAIESIKIARYSWCMSGIHRLFMHVLYIYIYKFLAFRDETDELYSVTGIPTDYIWLSSYIYNSIVIFFLTVISILMFISCSVLRSLSALLNTKVWNAMIDFTAENLCILFCAVIIPTVSLVVLTVVTLSLFDQSVGFNHYYVSCLLKIFEVIFLL